MCETCRIQRYSIVGDIASTIWDLNLSRSLNLDNGPQCGRSLGHELQSSTHYSVRV
jgi:hypothetical protein